MDCQSISSTTQTAVAEVLGQSMCKKWHKPDCGQPGSSRAGIDRLGMLITSHELGLSVTGWPEVCLDVEQMFLSLTLESS